MEATQVIVGLGSCGIAAGANKTYNKILAFKEADKLNFELKKTSCIGMCYREPLVEVIDSTGSYMYGEMDEEKAVQMIESHIKQGVPVRDFIVSSDLYDAPDNDYLNQQVRIVLRNCGRIDPESVEEYEARDGYRSIKGIIQELSLIHI